jgi:hypothetical protein
MVDVTEFEGYGAGHEGALNPFGGEITLERAFTPAGEIGEVNGFVRLWDNIDEAEEPYFPPPGACEDITPPEWPIPPPPNTTFADLGPEMIFTSGARGESFTVPRVMNDVDNLGRANEIMYGGTGPDGDFATWGDVDAGNINWDTTFDIAFSGPDGSEADLTPAQVYMPPEYASMEPPIGDEDLLTIQRGEDLAVSWEVVNQTGFDGQHTAERTFPFVFFQGFDERGTQVYCPLNDGDVYDGFTVPAEIIDALPPEGFIQVGQTSHYMSAFKEHRIDVFAITCRISDYEMAE